MPTLTLKNIPADLHARLKASAARNRRSLNSEILARLEGGGAPAQRDREAYSRALRAFTGALPRIDHRLATGFKRSAMPSESKPTTPPVSAPPAPKPPQISPIRVLREGTLPKR